MILSKSRLTHNNLIEADEAFRLWGEFIKPRRYEYFKLKSLSGELLIFGEPNRYKGYAREDNKYTESDILDIQKTEKVWFFMPQKMRIAVYFNYAVKLRNKIRLTGLSFNEYNYLVAKSLEFYTKYHFVFD